MQYRKFGKLDWKGSALGFGTMRLPQLGQEMGSPIDEKEAVKMIRYAIDNGVNYVDTAFAYGMGDSERVVGKALQDGYRLVSRRGQQLVDADPAFLVQQDKIGKGAADVDAEDHDSAAGSVAGPAARPASSR